LGYARSYLWPVCEARAITSINRWRRVAPSKQGPLLAVADALAEYGVELRDIVGPGRGDLVSGTVAVLGQDRQLRELGPFPANRSAALAGHQHHTFKDRGEVAGGAYNHKTMPDWRVKRDRPVMNRRADHIERNAGENQPHRRRRHGY
jgi:hypothetical protein